jgi:hypothetical protein
MANIKFKWHGNKAKAIVKEAGEHALQVCGQDLKGKSVPLAPVDTGDLRGSCNVSKPRKIKRSIFVNVGYNTPYALKQHEHLEYKHPKGGQAKYLETPFNQYKDRYAGFIKQFIKEALEKG